MRDSTQASSAYFTPRAYPTPQHADTALAEMVTALDRAKESVRNCQMVTYQTRNELIRYSAAFKESINVSADEYTYDLAALLDLVALTAFGSQQHRNRDALELMERTLQVLQRCLSGSADAKGDCADMTEEVWTWLGNSNGVSTRF